MQKVKSDHIKIKGEVYISNQKEVERIGNVLINEDKIVEIPYKGSSA